MILIILLLYHNLEGRQPRRCSTSKVDKINRCIILTIGRHLRLFILQTNQEKRCQINQEIYTQITFIMYIIDLLKKEQYSTQKKIIIDFYLREGQSPNYVDTLLNKYEIEATI